MGVSDFYQYLPTCAQHAAVSLYGLYWRQLRFGPGYSAALHEYLSRDRWTAQQWEAWRQETLSRILADAAENVPYYRDAWNLVQKESARSGSLQGLPLLDKEPLRASPQAFLRNGISQRQMHTFYTSGSTGTPIAACYSTRELRSSMALREARSLGWAGVSFTLPRATFSGRMVEPRPNSEGPYYRYNAAENQVYFSAFHLRPDTAKQYASALYRHRIVWATGYAVSFFLLAQLLLEQGIMPPALKAVITTSEKLTPDMRAVIGQAFQCPVYEEYSTVENAIFACECNEHRLHVSPDAGIVEILRPDGSPCAAGEPGEVVVTPFLRTAQPLIRYRLGDVASWDPAPCPCGRQMPVIQEVVGRIEDVVIGPDGRRMVRFHGVFTHQPNIREGQIIQEALDVIRVKVVPTKDYGPSDAEEIVSRVQHRLGDDVKVIVETTDMIPRTSAGKFRAVISKLTSSPAGTNGQ